MDNLFFLESQDSWMLIFCNCWAVSKKVAVAPVAFAILLPYVTMSSKPLYNYSEIILTIISLLRQSALFSSKFNTHPSNAAECSNWHFTWIPTAVLKNRKTRLTVRFYSGCGAPVDVASIPLPLWSRILIISHCLNNQAMVLPVVSNRKTVLEVL